MDDNPYWPSGEKPPKMQTVMVPGPLAWGIIFVLLTLFFLFRALLW